MHGNREPAHRRAQGAHGLRRLRGRRLERPRPGRRAAPTRAARRRSTPASTCTWRPDSWKGLYDNTLAQARSGEIPMARLDDAVRRILRVKVGRAVRRAERPLDGPASTCSARPSTARWRARRCAKSLVLLKNNGGVLPLRRPAPRAGRRRRRRRHRQAVRRLDAHLAGHRQQPTPTSRTASRSAPACARRWRPAAARPSSSPTARSRTRPTSRSWCSARSPTPSSRATCPRSSTSPATSRPGAAAQAEGAGHPGGGGVPLRPAAVGQPRAQRRRRVRRRLAAGPRRRRRRRRAGPPAGRRGRATTSAASCPSPGRKRPARRR